MEARRLGIERGRRGLWRGGNLYARVPIFLSDFFFIIFLWASSGLGFNFRAEAHSAESCQKAPKQ